MAGKHPCVEGCGLALPDRQMIPVVVHVDGRVDWVCVACWPARAYDPFFTDKFKRELVQWLKL